MNKEIGSRIRTIRKERGLSLRALAAKCGVSASFLSQVERGESSISIVSLMAVCEILDIQVGSLLPGQETSEPERTDSAPGGAFEVDSGGCPVLRKGDCPTIRIPSSKVTYTWLSGPSRENAIEVVIGEFPPHCTNPVHAHQGEEFGYILEGMIDVHIDGSTYSLSPADSYSISGSQPHGFSTGGQRAKILWYHTRRFMEWYASTRS